jgi:hypothetical protein
VSGNLPVIVWLLENGLEQYTVELPNQPEIKKSQQKYEFIFKSKFQVETGLQQLFFSSTGDQAIGLDLVKNVWGFDLIQKKSKQLITDHSSLGIAAHKNKEGWVVLTDMGRRIVEIDPLFSMIKHDQNNERYLDILSVTNDASVILQDGINIIEANLNLDKRKLISPTFFQSWQWLTEDKKNALAVTVNERNNEMKLIRKNLKNGQWIDTESHTERMHRGFCSIQLHKDLVLTPRTVLYAYNFTVPYMKLSSDIFESISDDGLLVASSRRIFNLSDQSLHAELPTSNVSSRRHHTIPYGSLEKRFSKFIGSTKFIIYEPSEKVFETYDIIEATNQENRQKIIGEKWSFKSKNYSLKKPSLLKSIEY